MRVVGLISGTSLDAIDVAVVDLQANGKTLRAGLVGWSEQPWPPDVRGSIAGWSEPGATAAVADVAAASMAVGQAFGGAALGGIAAAGVDVSTVDAVASHGQTVHHRIGDSGRAVATLQLGEPAVIAEMTGRTVVADFRPRDIAAGGQGAPLVSFVDALLLADVAQTVAALNLGGIANVTVIPAGRARESIAFDTGPGNSLIDGCARHLLGQLVDRDGAAASAGTPSEPLLEGLLADPYFDQAPPKSTGRELFGDGYVERVLARARELAIGPSDTLATVTELTARSVARALVRWAPDWPAAVHVSGGGTSNPTLMGRLEAALRAATPAGCAPPRLLPFDETGLPSAAKEAFCFAVLGHETLHGRPNSLPGATGARHAAVLGAIWPGANYAALLARITRAPSIERVDRIELRRSSEQGSGERKGATR